MMARVEDLTVSAGGGNFNFAVDESLLASMSPDEVRASMRALGYRTQNELASAIGVSRSAVSLWLEGKVGVPRPVAMLLRMLGYEPGNFDMLVYYSDKA